MATFSRRATLAWIGDVPRGSGAVTAGSEAFSLPVTFPRLKGEAARSTTPEELLAASHATCFGIGLRSVIAQRGGIAERISVTATVTAEKGSGAIRIHSSHLRADVEGLVGIEAGSLNSIAQAAEEGCTISALIRPTVAITVEIDAV
jgi:osmotically inducible protein OsmC